MFYILWRVMLALSILSTVLIVASRFVAPEVNAKDYTVYHVAHSMRSPDYNYYGGYDLYLHDQQRHIYINISHVPCAKEIMPEALTGSTGRYLYVSMENDRLVIVDSYWGVVCRL